MLVKIIHTLQSDLVFFSNGIYIEKIGYGSKKSTEERKIVSRLRENDKGLCSIAETINRL